MSKDEKQGRIPGLMQHSKKLFCRERYLAICFIAVMRAVENLLTI